VRAPYCHGISIKFEPLPLPLRPQLAPWAEGPWPIGPPINSAFNGVDYQSLQIAMRAFLLLACLLCGAHAATIFVDPSGNDGNAGASNSKKATISGAVTAANNGDIIILSVTSPLHHSSHHS